MAVVQEYNDSSKTADWYAYIINEKDVDLEMILVVSIGYSEDKTTSTMRHKLDQLPSKSYAKIEVIQDDVLKLNNEFKVSFFEGNKIFEKSFFFKANFIDENALQSIPLMNTEGVLLK